MGEGTQRGTDHLVQGVPVGQTQYDCLLQPVLQIVAPQVPPQAEMQAETLVAAPATASSRGSSRFRSVTLLIASFFCFFTLASF